MTDKTLDAPIIFTINKFQSVVIKMPEMTNEEKQLLELQKPEKSFLH